MRLTSCLTMLSVIALLGGCVPGNFCDVAKPDVYNTQATLDYLLDNDPQHVRADLAENEYGAKYCGWGTVVPFVGD